MHSKPNILSLAPCSEWTRSFQGLNKVAGAVEAWRRAVAALPKGNLTPAEQKQQARYSVELATAQKRLDDSKARPLQPDGFLLREKNEDVPWKRALAMLPSLTTWESSVSPSHRVTSLPKADCSDYRPG